MCKTMVNMKFYFNNIRKHEHKMKQTRLWCKIVPQTYVEQIKSNRKLFLFISFCEFSSRKLSQRLPYAH
jgi:hypothetical protein